MCDELAKGVGVGWCDVSVALGWAEGCFVTEYGEWIGLAEPSGFTEGESGGLVSTDEVGVELIASNSHVASVAPPDASGEIGVSLVEGDEADNSHCGGRRIQDEQAAFGRGHTGATQLYGLAAVQDCFGEPWLDRYQQGSMPTGSVAGVAVGCAHAGEL
jgi:hypothetical protein